MARIIGVKRDQVHDDIAVVYDRLQARYGTVLVNHMVLARCPEIFHGFRAMWDGIEGTGLLAPTLLSLINLRVARLAGCALCIEINSAVGLAEGLSHEQLGALDDFEIAAVLSEPEKASLAYADAITNEGTVPPQVFARVARSFSPDQIVALTAAITFELCVARFNRALEIEGQGICAVTKPAE